MLIISDIESKEYGKHYGATKSEYLASGQGLSDSIVLKGKVRGIYDTFLCTHDVLIHESILCWKFNEPVTLLGGAILVMMSELHSADIRADIYDGDTHKANLITSVFDNLHTWEWHGRKGLSQNPYITNISPGDTLMFSSSEGTLLSGIKIAYNLQFMTES